MHLSQDNDVVHTLTPDRPDQPLGKAILTGRGWCSGLVPDAHGTQSARDDNGHMKSETHHHYDENRTRKVPF